MPEKPAKTTRKPLILRNLALKTLEAALRDNTLSIDSRVKSARAVLEHLNREVQS